jgi:ferredoxin-type protein NapG
MRHQGGEGVTCPAGNSGVTRRRFLKDGVLVPLAFTVAAGGLSTLFLRRAEGSAFYLRPPGALPEPRFLAACVRCGRCAQACPYKAVKMAGGGTGTAFGTPHILARETPCSLCPDIPCAKACPSGALDNKLDDIAKIRMGTAVIVDRESCLSLRGLRCEVCYRQCPLIDKAISIVPRHNERTGTHSIMEPVVHSDKCVGCGICEHACVLEKPAIVVLKSSPKQKDAYDF